MDVSQDDFSGPEAERRYRSLQTNMPDETLNEEPPAADPVEDHVLEAPEDHMLEDVEDHVPQAEDDHIPEAVDEQRDEPPPRATQSGSLRRRLRKQVDPARAPFF